MSGSAGAGFVVRLTRRADVPLLADIERSAASLFRETDRAWVADEAPTDADCHIETIDAGLHWVAVLDEMPIGFLLAELADDAIYVAELSVARSHQRRGAGRLLMEAVERAARDRGIQWVTLTTYRDLPWNAPFYRRLGFPEPPDLPSHLVDNLRDQAAKGHDPALRCGMVKWLG